MFAHRYLISAVVLGCCAIPASATLTVSSCTNQTCFDTATGTDVFSNIDFTQGSLGVSTTDLGVVFSDSAGLTGTANPTGWPTGTALEEPNSDGTTMTITIPSGVNTIDLYFGLYNSYNNFSISVTDNSGGTYYAEPATSVLTTPNFLALTTDSSFASFTITSFNTANPVAIDDVQIGMAGADDPAEAPEAATMLLVATGLFLIRFARRRTPGAV